MVWPGGVWPGAVGAVAAPVEGVPVAVEPVEVVLWAKAAPANVRDAAAASKASLLVI